MKKLVLGALLVLGIVLLLNGGKDGTVSTNANTPYQQGPSAPVVNLDDGVIPNVGTVIQSGVTDLKKTARDFGIDVDSLDLTNASAVHDFGTVFHEQMNSSGQSFYQATTQFGAPRDQSVQAIIDTLPNEVKPNGVAKAPPCVPAVGGRTDCSASWGFNTSTWDEAVRLANLSSYCKPHDYTEAGKHFYGVDCRVQGAIIEGMNGN